MTGQGTGAPAHWEPLPSYPKPGNGPTLDASLTSAGLAIAVSTDHRSPRPNAESTFRRVRETAAGSTSCCSGFAPRRC